jgi:hypothetical protein
MPEDMSPSVKIRVKSGESEAEIEAPLATIRQAIELIPEVLSRLPKASAEPRQAPSAIEVQSHGSQEPSQLPPAAASAPASLPTVTVERGDSLSDVISKFFSDAWGRNPRKLMEVREALQSYGLNYPKQSVAVALLRLAKGSKIRRFKGEGGEYVYTASNGAVRIQSPQQLPATQQVEASVVPTTEDGAEVEEQLNLDAPTPH